MATPRTTTVPVILMSRSGTGQASTAGSGRWRASGRVSHNGLTDWGDGTGLRHPHRTPSGRPAAADSGALAGRAALIYGSEGWGPMSSRAHGDPIPDRRRDG